jgi:hypothetical protein
MRNGLTRTTPSVRSIDLGGWASGATDPKQQDLGELWKAFAFAYYKEHSDAQEREQLQRIYGQMLKT